MNGARSCGTRGFWRVCGDVCLHLRLDFRVTLEARPKAVIQATVSYSPDTKCRRADFCLAAVIFDFLKEVLGAHVR